MITWRLTFLRTINELDCLRVEHQCRMMELGFMQSIIVEIVCEMGDLILCKHVPNVVKEIEKRGLRYSEGHWLTFIEWRGRWFPDSLVVTWGPTKARYVQFILVKAQILKGWEIRASLNYRGSKHLIIPGTRDGRLCSLFDGPPFLWGDLYRVVPWRQTKYQI